MSGVRAFLKKRGGALCTLAMLIALTVCAVLYAQSRILPPARDELLAASGTVRSTEYSRLALERDGEALGSFKLDERLVPNRGELLRRIAPGDEAALLYIDDEDRTVMELTVNGETLLTYDRASAMWSEDTVWTVGTLLLAVVGALAALGGIVAVTCWKNRRKAARERISAEEAAREELRHYARVRYGADEQRALEAYITDAFGSVGRVYYELDEDVPHIDLVVCEPSRGRPLYTVTTLGLGAFRLGVPEELEEHNRSFVELAMLLPRDWRFAENTWPLTVLKSLARGFIVERDDAPSEGNAYYLDAEEREASGFAAVLVIPASVREGINPRVLLPGGRLVSFYLLVPLYEAEWNYIFVRDSSLRLWRRMAKRGMGVFVQPERECCVDPETWLDEELAPFYFGENAARGEYYFGLSDLRFCAECFTECGLTPSGHTWERAARECARETGWREVDALEFSSTEEMLFIESENETLLRRFALRLRDLCEDDVELMELLERSKEENDGT